MPLLSISRSDEGARKSAFERPQRRHTRTNKAIASGSSAVHFVWFRFKGHEALDPVHWLLEGDPSIRWQALRDLVGAPAMQFEQERGKVASEGWGARLLALQGPDGAWPSEYHPDVYRGRPTSRHYIYKPDGCSTFYAMLLLRDLGLAPDDHRAHATCSLLLNEGVRADGGVMYMNDDGTTPSETCVTGMALSILSYFEVEDERLDTIAQHLVDQQMPDGGWNCQRVYGATHASMHTTILVLEGFHHYERHRGPGGVDPTEAASRGREFLLAHRLFRSHRTGEPIDPKTQHTHVSWPPFTVFVFPTQWHYDILRALDHFRAVEAPRDDRLSEAVENVMAARRPSGRWLLPHRWEPPTYFPLERVGRLSRWNTLRALRVLKWWADG